LDILAEVILENERMGQPAATTKLLAVSNVPGE